MCCSFVLWLDEDATCFCESVLSINELFPFCVLDIKECSLPYNICQNGGTCEERLGDYYCNCALGFAGKNCDKGTVIFYTFIENWL